MDLDIILDDKTELLHVTFHITMLKVVSIDLRYCELDYEILIDMQNTIDDKPVVKLFIGDQKHFAAVKTLF